MRKLFISGLLFMVAVMGMGQEGLSVGAETWNAPGRDNYDDESMGGGVFAEYERAVDIVDIYTKGLYLVNFDDETNQALYLQERLAVNVEGIGPGKLSVSIDNYNLFAVCTDDVSGDIYYYSPNDTIYVGTDIKKVTGVLEPGVGYAINGWIVGAGMPVGYAPLGGTYRGAQYVDGTLIVGFEHDMGIGLSVKGYYNFSHEWDDGKDKTREDLYEIDVIASYGSELFAVFMEVDCIKDWDGKLGKDFLLMPGAEVYIDNVTIYGFLEFDCYNDINGGQGEKESKVYSGFLVGAKYAFK
jgi:hypothetical protein